MQLILNNLVKIFKWDLKGSRTSEPSDELWEGGGRILSDISEK